MKKSLLRFTPDLLENNDIHIRRKSVETSYENHWHSYFEIVLYKQCNGKCFLNGTEYKIKDNCMFLLTPKDCHEIINEKKSTSLSYIISFSENAVDKEIIKLGSVSPLVLYDVPNLIVENIDYMNTIFKNKNYKNNMGQLRVMLNFILLYMCDNGIVVEGKSENINNYVSKAIYYVITNPNSDVSLKYIADMLHISYGYFSILFRKEMGIPYKKYITLVKVDYAKRLLESTDMQITDVCYECGFKNDASFIRKFKKEVGCSPLKYRKNSKCR